MLRREINELLTQTGPGTPMGELFRQYWMPACLAEELPEDGAPPVRLKLLSDVEPARIFGSLVIPSLCWFDPFLA